jgi:hypothetical protein
MDIILTKGALRIGDKELRWKCTSGTEYANRIEMIVGLSENCDGLSTSKHYRIIKEFQNTKNIGNSNVLTGVNETTHGQSNRINKIHGDTDALVE